ncbi:MAG: hypothetical protein VBE63_17530 [Lamprobacter sp.]|uniref:hypothetical protein n=1 Tax=Lamprobacter sp. TaxID=3100796 RepID=UPI002B2625DF|nr:hypothetical protein [Lamprobacter sp.]MEA3641719.1 hypothetical protein [Lamprobacter sp.]
MSNLTDEEVVHRLGSTSPETADAAAKEVLNRGERLFELLLRLRDNRRPFAGRALLNPDASILMPTPIEGFPLPDSEQERLVTVEVAALYLISAAFYRDIHFAQAPLLVDLEEPREKRRAANTAERLDRALRTTEFWVTECRQVGIDTLRSKGRAPLDDGHLKWF